MKSQTKEAEKIVRDENVESPGSFASSRTCRWQNRIESLKRVHHSYKKLHYAMPCRPIRLSNSASMPAHPTREMVCAGSSSSTPSARVLTIPVSTESHNQIWAERPAWAVS